ncbi:DNase I-like protein [Hymenopellis radicata]|nr:DNase I-like protein [Hymenopellis radicata]
MRISSLNIKGRTSIDDEDGTQEKVNQIPNMMRSRRIGMLALQETHYTEDYVAEVTARFGDTIHIEYSRPVGRRASRAEGVALVFYKPTTNVLGIEKREVIPGRSMIVASHWHGEDELKTMVGYAPNAAKENKEFWQTNEKYIDENPEWTPDAVCIDANLVPEAIDRLPAHEDDQEAVAAMKSFLKKCDLVDGWREENPGESRFTFTQETDCPSHSRLDRIYVKRSRIAQSRSWDMELTKIDGIKTDHKRVSCEITTAEAPEQGHGRYTAPLYVAKTSKMVQLVDKTGKELTSKMMLAAAEQRTEKVNPQTLYAKWKRTISDELRREAKTIIPRAKKKISELQEKLKRVSRDTAMDDPVKQQEIANIERDISRIGGEVWEEKSATAKANQALLGDANSKYYTRLIKGTKARDPIMSLKIPETQPPQYERDPEKMTI